MPNKRKTITAQDKLQRVEAAIERTQRRINRNHNALIRLQRQRKRLVSQLHMATIDRELAKVKPAPKPDQTTAAMQTLTGVVEKPDALDIPTFLARGMKAQNAVDEAAKAAILAEQQAKAKAKAKASSEKSRAKKRGELRKMPLQGKAALAAIRESD